MTLTTRLIASTIFIFVGVSNCNLHAQWTVTTLHPATLQSTEARGASGTVQVGNYYAGSERACMWSGTAASWVNLDPAGSVESMALGASAVNQVGWADVNGRRRASLWSGSAASWVDLNPTWAWQSWALDAWGSNQVGWAYDGSVGRAGLWSGTAASWVDLHPAGTDGSEASAIADGTQVGWAIVNGTFHASKWSGTAASWVDLNPAGAFQSEARGVSGGYQVGFADIGGIRHASLWNGTAASWVSLHPTGPHRSELHAAYGPIQVGEAGVNFNDHASVWFGTAESWFDLHTLLPPGFAYSYALGVSSDGVNYYVTGLGYNVTDGRFEALLWTQPVSEPAFPEGMKLLDGVISAGQMPDLFDNDNQYLELDPSPTTNFRKQKIHLILQSTSSSGLPSNLAFRLKAKMIGGTVAGDVIQTIELFNYQTGRFEIVDTRATELADELLEITPPGDPGRFVQPGTSEVTAGITWKSESFSGRPFLWSIDVDQAIWMVSQ